MHVNLKESSFSRFDTAIINGWLYIVAPDGRAMGLSAEGARELRKHITEYLAGVGDLNE
jgi:hypothetical protein